jgi:hypothetical protein
MSLLNVTQVPTIVIIDSDTGRPVSRESALAIEWNDPHDRFNDNKKDGFNAWQAGGSGLTAWQKCFPWLPVKVTALSSGEEMTPGRSQALVFASKKSSKCCHEALTRSGAAIVSLERSLAVWRLQSIMLATCDALSRQLHTLCLAVTHVFDLTTHPHRMVFEAGAQAERRLVGPCLPDWMQLALWNCLASF